MKVAVTEDVMIAFGFILALMIAVTVIMAVQLLGVYDYAYTPGSFFCVWGKNFILGELLATD